MNDVDMTFQSYEQLFGVSHNQINHIFDDDDGIDSFFDLRETSAANSNHQDEFVGEVHLAACSSALLSLIFYQQPPTSFIVCISFSKSNISSSDSIVITYSISAL